MQTLVFNTSTKKVTLYEGAPEKSTILHVFNNIPTVKTMDNHYEVIQNYEQHDKESEESPVIKKIPVARFPISNTNMLINK